MRSAILILVLAGAALAQEAAGDPEPDAAELSRRAVAAAIPLLEDAGHSAAAFRVVTNAWDRKHAHAELLRQMVLPDVVVGRTYLRALISTSDRADQGGYLHIGLQRDWLPPDFVDYLPRLAQALPQKRGAALASALELVLLSPKQLDGPAGAVVRLWPDLPDAHRKLYLEFEWDRIRSPELLALLVPLLDLPAKHTSSHVPDLRSLVVQRLVEAGSEEARKIVLADMALPAPTLAWCALGALPDDELPEMEAVWKKSLEDREFRDLWKLSQLIERYATSDMQPVVLSRLHSAKWACSIANAFLGYLMKHDRATGLAEVRAAAMRRGEGETGCYRRVLSDVLPRYWGPDAESLAIEFLADPDEDVARSAVDALLESGSVDCATPLLDLAAKSDDGKCQLYSTIIMGMMRTERWKLSSEVRQRLFDILRTDYARREFRARFGE